MRIPTVEQLKVRMLELSICHLDIALTLGVSERTMYRMLEPEKLNERMRLKDRAAVGFVLDQMEKEKETFMRIEGSGEFCECADPEKFKPDGSEHYYCAVCQKRIKEIPNEN